MNGGQLRFFFEFHSRLRRFVPSLRKFYKCRLFKKGVCFFLTMMFMFVQPYIYKLIKLLKNQLYISME
jgi:hypothetical protein